MALLGAALPWIAAAGTVVGAVTKAEQDKKASDILKFNAGQARATGQHQAESIGLVTQERQSRLRALAASSGGGLQDPTIQNLATGVGTEGVYRQMSAMAAGESVAQGDEMKARALRAEQTPTIVSGVLSGASSLFSKRLSMADKYGNGGFQGNYDDGSYAYGMS